MMTEFTREDRLTLEVFDRLNRDGEVALEETRLGRECAELLALLPYNLDPVAPRPEIWRRIKARLGTATIKTDFVTTSEVPESKFPERRSSTLVRFPRVTEGAVEPASTPAPLSAAANRSKNTGIFALAAALAFCMLGLGYLLATTQFQKSAIKELRENLALAQIHNAEMTWVESQYEMVTRTARQYYPMRPTAAASRGTPVHGRVWVCGQHQQWLLNIEGLHPAPSGFEYRFWYETDRGTIAAGVLEVEGNSVELASPSMPLGTRGFRVTLEKKDRGPEAPPLGEPLLVAGTARRLDVELKELENELSVAR